MIEKLLNKYSVTIAKFQRLWVRGEVKVAFFSTWLFTVLFVFGFLGIGVMLKTLGSKDVLIDKLLDVNSRLEKNILELKKAEGLISNSKVNIGYFEKRMPNDKNEESYIKEIYLTCIQSNYTLTGISQGSFTSQTKTEEDGPKENEVRYLIKARGSTSPDNLIENLEKLQRITYVRKVEFDEKNKIYTVSLELSAFYTKEEAL